MTWERPPSLDSLSPIAYRKEGYPAPRITGSKQADNQILGKGISSRKEGILKNDVLPFAHFAL